MLFTRHPIVETIITPKEGHQLKLKAPAAAGQDYLADALELVIYGSTPFYRSLEGPRPFLVPAAHFEVEQVKEGRAPLKHATYERKAAREPPSRETKKSSAAPRERLSANREEKNDTLGNVSDHWERHKNPRKRANSTGSTPSPSSSKSSVNSDPAKVPSPAEIYEAFRYDLVPPPETFVNESMENLQKSKERADTKPTDMVDKIEQNAHGAPMDAVEAILKASGNELDPPNEPPIG